MMKYLITNYRHMQSYNQQKYVKICEQTVRFQLLTAASMKFRFVFWDVLPCKKLSTDVSEVRAASIIRAIVGRQLFYTALHPRRQI
jgi:hypothetical protein